jgi:hypothetical protein
MSPRPQEPAISESKVIHAGEDRSPLCRDGELRAPRFGALCRVGLDARLGRWQVAA